MKRWILLVALALFAVGGCKSMPSPPAEKEEKPAFGSQAPNGEASPFLNETS